MWTGATRIWPASSPHWAPTSCASRPEPDHGFPATGPDFPTPSGLSYARSTVMTLSRPIDVGALLDEARAGDRRALARLLTVAERGGDNGRAAAALAYRSGTE